MQTEFISSEVVALTGITARQLQWWDERGIVVPERQGHRRLYSLNDLTEVAVICDLRRRGFPLQKVRKVIRFRSANLAGVWQKLSVARPNITCLRMAKPSIWKPRRSRFWTC